MFIQGSRENITNTSLTILLLIVKNDNFMKLLSSFHQESNVLFNI